MNGWDSEAFPSSEEAVFNKKENCGLNSFDGGNCLCECMCVIKLICLFVLLNNK